VDSSPHHLIILSQAKPPAVAQLHPVQVGNQDFAIDLGFFHRALQCLVAFEQKVAMALRVENRATNKAGMRRNRATAFCPVPPEGAGGQT